MLQSQVHAAATAAPTIADPRIADPAFAPSASVRSARTGQGRRAAFWRVYMAAWMVLAGASVVYLAMFAASPEVQQRVLAKVETELLGVEPRPQEALTASLETASPPPAVVPTPAEPLMARESPSAPFTRGPSTPGSRPNTADDRDQTATPTETAAKDEPVKALNEELASLRAGLARAQEAPAGAPEREPRFAATPANDGTANVLPRSSPFTTASIPRTSAPARTPAAGGSAPEASLRPPQQPEILNRGPEANAEEPSAAAAAEEPPPAAAAPARKPGRNLAISPLRAGRLPPIPGRDLSRAPTPAAYHLAPSASPYATTSAGYSAASASGTQPAPYGGTPAPSAPSFGTATVTPAATPGAAPGPQAAALALSSAPSVTGLRASWLLLTTRHGQALAGFQPRYTVDPVTGTYRLLAGPIADRTEADRICGMLIADDIRCGVTLYTGTPL